MNACLRGISAALLVLFFSSAALSTVPEGLTPVEEHWDMVRKNPGDPSLGPDNAEIVIVEFIDYACPYCRKMAPDIVKLHERNPDVQIVFKEFPILGPASDRAARASLAAARQDGWLAFHAFLMASRAGLTIDEAIQEAALAADLDLDRLYADMTDPGIVSIIDRNIALGDLLNVRATPTIVLGERTLSQAVPFDIMQDFVQFAKGDFDVDDMTKFATSLIDRPGGLFGNGYEGLARHVLETSLQLDPNRWEIHHGLSRVTYGDRRIDHLSDAIQLKPDNAELYLRRGHEWGEDDNDKAITDYTTVLRLDPGYAMAHYWRAGKHGFRCTDPETTTKSNSLAYLEIADYRNFIRIETAKELQSQDFTFVSYAFKSLAVIWRCLGKLDREDSAHAERIGYLESVHSKLSMENKEYNTRNLVKAYEDQALFLLMRGDREAMMRQVKAAIERATGSEESVCNSAASNEGILIAIMEQDQDDESVWRILQEWKDSGCFHWAGRIRLREYENSGDTGALETAERYIKESIVLDPDNGFYMGVLADVLRKKGDYEGLVEVLDTAIHADFGGLNDYVENAMGHNLSCLKATAVRNVQKYWEAISNYEQCIIEEPQWAGGFKELAWLLAAGPDEVRDAEYAVELAGRAVELEGGDGVAKLVLGTALAEAGKPEKAIRAYEDAIRDEPGLVVHYRRALRDAGHGWVEESGAYDHRTRDTWRKCVRAGCRVQ